MIRIYTRSRSKLGRRLATRTQASYRNLPFSPLHFNPNNLKLSSELKMSSESPKEKDKPFTVCVFCGASPGKSPIFTQAAQALAEALHRQSWHLVYGGGIVGLMGLLASTLVSLSGPQSVHGIIPAPLIYKEAEGLIPPYEKWGETTVVKDMHTRKAMMGREADAFVAMPGGFGTTEELLEAVTWNQLGIHSCPIVILNTDGFYDGLLSWINTAVERGFIGSDNKSIVVEAKSVDEIVDLIKNYKPASGRLDLDWEVQ